MAKKIFSKRTLALVLALVMCLSMLQMTAYAAPGDSGNWTYAYYLGQEYLGNAAGAPIKPDPVGYGFQGVITSLTFTDDAGTSWTFNWSSEANGEWRITGRNVSQAKASAWPQITDGKTYVGYCGNSTYVFTLGNEGSSESWTYARNGHANWFRYIRFIREYTVNVFYQNETGSVVYNGVSYTAAEPLTRYFTFLYPDGGIIDDSEYEDGEYTDPTTLMPSDYLTQAMKDQGYEIKYATDANGKDVLSTGVTISLLGQNILNVYCTLIPPATENYSVVHNYYMDGAYEGTQSGGSIEVTQGTDFADVVAGITKLTSYNGNTYTYISYEVDPAAKVITLTYNRARPTYRYAVTYNANFGVDPATAADTENALQVYDTTKTITVDVNSFTRENYAFIGWATESDGEVVYAPGAKLSFVRGGSQELFAKWELVDRDYTVEYLVQVDDNPYEEFPGDLPEDIHEGGTLPHGTTVGEDIVNPPAQLDDGTYVYEFVSIEEIQLGDGENIVKVYYKHVTPEDIIEQIPDTPAPQPEPEPEPPVVEIPEEPVPQAETPEAPAEDPAPANEPVEGPVEEPAPKPTVDDSGLVELPDEEVPLADAPKTGDPMLLYAGMTALSGAGLAWLGLSKKKEEEEE